MLYTEIQIVLLCLIFINILLGFFVLFYKDTSSNNSLFSVVLFTAAIWTLTNYLANAQSSLIWIESSYAFGALVLYFGLLWIANFCKTPIKGGRFVFVTFVTLLIILTSYRFTITSYSATEFQSQGTSGLGLFFYAIWYLVASIWMLRKLYFGMKPSQDALMRYQCKLIFIGCLICLFITLIASFILPVFSIFIFSGIDSIGFLLFMIFICYAIIRHKLFNIKIITIEIVMFLLWVVILQRVFLSKNLHELITESILFIISFVLGLTLIRTILHELRLQLRIDTLTEELHKAYAQTRSLSDKIENYFEREK